MSRSADVSLSFAVPSDGVLSEPQAQEVVELSDLWQVEPSELVEVLARELDLSPEQRAGMTHCVDVYVVLQSLVAAGVVVKVGSFYTNVREGSPLN